MLKLKNNKKSNLKKGLKYIGMTSLAVGSLSFASFGLDQDINGVYQINNKQDLIDFSAKVNGGEEDANAIVNNMCDVNEYLTLVFEDEGAKELTNDEIKYIDKRWTPIGTEMHPYKGNFDGNNQIISGLFVEGEDRNPVEVAGLFGHIGEGATIRNVMLLNSYFNAEHVEEGGLYGINNGGTIENNNVYNSFIYEGRMPEPEPENLVLDEITGVYHIKTGEGLRQFAALVNDVNNEINAVIDDDIVVEGVWAPIGTEERPYIGKFNGNWKGIHGINIEDPEKDNVGFFGVVGKGGEIEGISLTEAHFVGHNNVGNIAGKNSGIIKNSNYNSEIIRGNENVGGYVGYNTEDGIIDGMGCGRVEGVKNVGGVIGLNEGKIGHIECFGNVVAGMENVGVDVGLNNGEFEKGASRIIIEGRTESINLQGEIK